MAARGVAAAAPQVAQKAAEVARRVGPSPEELVAAGEKAAEALRERNPELMAKASDAARRAVGKAGEYFPGVVERASSIVNDAQGRKG